jgi:hypothetical protein
VKRPRAADDFAAIRARMEELRREREGVEATNSDRQRDAPMPRRGSIRWSPSEVNLGARTGTPISIKATTDAEDF